MTKRVRRLLLAVPFLTVAALAHSEVVSSYVVNGHRLFSGTSYAQMREVAGEPLRVSQDSGQNRYVEWIYHCDRVGTGPCTVVAEGGKRELRARFIRGRLKVISYAPL